MDLKQLRQDMIVVQNTINNQLQSSREVAMAYTSAQRAMAWTGTFMKYLNVTENPYAKNDGNRKGVEDIQPLSNNTEEELSFDFEGVSEGSVSRQIFMIDKIRRYVADRVEGFSHTMSEGVLDANYKEVYHRMNAHIAASQVVINLEEIRINLGFQLGVLRDKSGDNKVTHHKV